MIPLMLDEGGRKSFRWSPSDPLDTNRFPWKSSFSIRKRLRMIPLMLDEGAESRSDGVHWIHWTRIDYDGKVYFLFVRDLE